MSAELAWPNDSFEPPYNFLERLDHIKKVKSIFFLKFFEIIFIFVHLFILTENSLQNQNKNFLCKN